MRSRCLNPKNIEYQNYGGRGISVCERWRASFAAFLADMGERPPGTSIDRIDNDGNYEPGNCRWATQHQQKNNRRDSRRVTVNGETITITELSTRAGVARSTLWHRIVTLGWAPERAITVPLGKVPDRYRRRLTLHQEAEIRQRYAAGGVFLRTLAAEYGVSTSMIWLAAHDGRAAKLARARIRVV